MTYLSLSPEMLRTEHRKGKNDVCIDKQRPSFQFFQGKFPESATDFLKRLINYDHIQNLKAVTLLFLTRDVTTENRSYIRNLSSAKRKPEKN